MPRVAVPVTQSSRAGTVLPTATTGDATNNHSVANDGRVILMVKNTGATSRNITFALTTTVDGLAVTARVEAIPAGETQLFGPFDPNSYGTSLSVDVAHAELVLNAIRV